MAPGSCKKTDSSILSNRPRLTRKDLNIHQDTHATGFALAIHPKKTRILFASNKHKGQVYKSINGGKVWDLVFQHTGADANNRHGVKEIVISKSNPDTVYIGFINDEFLTESESENYINSFGVYKSIDGGETWVEANNGLEITTQNITALVVNPKNENELYIGLREGGLYYSDDGANSWHQIYEPNSNSYGVYPIAFDFQSYYFKY